MRGHAVKKAKCRSFCPILSECNVMFNKVEKGTQKQRCQDEEEQYMHCQLRRRNTNLNARGRKKQHGTGETC